MAFNTRNPRQSRGLRGVYPSLAGRGGFTLVEMLIAMAITLVMIGAVVTLFANISNGVRNRRAVIEMSGQLRHARNMLQQDLASATCNGLVWQRPDESQGYIEIIEGARREGQASVLVDGVEQPDPTASKYNPEIDHKTSIIPASNVLPFQDTTWLTDGGSLGDYDDILMLTVRNEHEPFVGRVPKSDGTATAVRQSRSNVARPFPTWAPTTIESPLAEVVWFAVENPEEDANAGGFFGEPGMRTIYRRALLIAPWLNPYRTVASDGTIDDTFRIAGDGSDFTAQPGLIRILPGSVAPNEVVEAIACLIAFQERYDLSVRLEFDPLLGNSPGRWKLVANTLGDLTKRENRYEHHFYRPGGNREYPFAAASMGGGYTGDNVAFQVDPEVAAAAGGITAATASAILDDAPNLNNFVSAYAMDTPNDPNGPYPDRPFVYVSSSSNTLATARAMLDNEGKVVRVLHGLVPLSGKRRGEDVMLSDALGFDLRVYDPGAPLFAHRLSETVLEPTDPAWLNAYYDNDNYTGSASSIGRNNTSPTPTFPFVGQGAYVDLGYGFDARAQNLPTPRPILLPTPQFAPAYASSTVPWYFAARALSNVFGGELAPGYAVFDTWSFHYENDGVDEDNRDADNNLQTGADEGTNGLDDSGVYFTSAGALITPYETRLGPDDVGERETVPPYDKPLRGVQVLLRLYERDSRQVKQVSVNQSFVPE